MKALKNNFDLVIFVLLITGYLFLATQRLATSPIYETDESYTLQVSYEMLNRGNLALPMYRYLGGNIENVWHSFTPLYFVLLSGFLKLFGIGVFQGRIFNLITFVLTLLLVYLLGRRMFNWRVGLFAIILIMSDQTVLERSRLLRNDYAAEALALLAFYLFEKAESGNRSRFYVAAGLAAGAGVMCHTSLLYMICAISLLMLLKDGWKVFKSRKLYQFNLSALAAMSYEIVYDIIDYKNFLLQYKRDDLHFSVLSGLGWWENLLDEPRRYLRWYDAYDVAFQNVPRTLLHTFQLLIAIAILYLAIRLVIFLRHGNAMAEPRVRIFIVTLLVGSFFAIAAHKAGYYLAHLVTWYGLCAGIMLNDVLIWIASLRQKQWRRAKLIHASAVALAGLAFIFYAQGFARQTRVYWKAVRNPDIAKFEELKSALKQIVPDGLCPVAVKAPIMWLAFPEADLCFATIENRMKEALDLSGKDYALIMRPKTPEHWAKDLPKGHHLIGELRDTAYGNFVVYYTGKDPRYLSLAPKRYQFFKRLRGHISEEQIARGREVLTTGADQLLQCSTSKELSVEGDSLMLKPANSGTNDLIELCSVDVQQGFIYQVTLETEFSGEWVIIYTDEKTGAWIEQSEIEGQGERQPVTNYFRTVGVNRIKIAFRSIGKNNDNFMRLSRLKVREVISIDESEQADYR
jgi:4-amino-4-deoxy-L-arabinose transferase-like glycosyltransferase